MSRFSRLWRAENVPWFTVAGAFAVFAALIGASVASYLVVADVHAHVSLLVGSSVAFEGLTSGGGLASNGTLAFTLRFLIINPSARDLAVNTVAYKVWAEDAPAEAGLSGLGRTDVRVANATGVHEFYLTFEGSIQVSPYSAPARTETPYPFTLNLTRVSDPARFVAMQNISEYAVRVLGSSSAIVWNVWTLLSLDIAGVLPPVSTTGNYLLGLTRVVLVWGTDLLG
jgi:hypothetical protein